MGVEAIILVEGTVDMRDQLSPTLTDAIPQVPTAEGAQRQLRLIHPGRMGRREVELDAACLRSQPRLGLSCNVRGTVVQDAMQAPDRWGQGRQVRLHTFDKVVVIIRG